MLLALPLVAHLADALLELVATLLERVTLLVQLVGVRAQLLLALVLSLNVFHVKGVPRLPAELTAATKGGGTSRAPDPVRRVAHTIDISDAQRRQRRSCGCGGSLPGRPAPFVEVVRRAGSRPRRSPATRGANARRRLATDPARRSDAAP